MVWRNGMPGKQPESTYFSRKFFLELNRSMERADDNSKYPQLSEKGIPAAEATVTNIENQDLKRLVT